MFVQATINGEVIGEFGSSPGSLFNALGIQGVGVETLTLKAVGLGANDWLSFTEVSVMLILHVLLTHEKSTATLHSAVYYDYSSS